MALNTRPALPLAAGAADGPAAGAAVAGAGRRRMEKRVTARTKATSRAARPASWAPTTGALSGRAEVSAASRAFTFDALFEFAFGDGLRVGNRPEALPPGLSVVPVVGLVTEMWGRVPTGSGDVDGAGDLTDADPAIATLVDAIGSMGRLAALPITVSRTDFTVDAVMGTMDSAWSCRSADFASIVPRSHEAVPSLLPQPKLNCGVTLAGVA